MNENDGLNPEVLKAVLDTLPINNAVIWLGNWLNAESNRRQWMESRILAEGVSA